MKGSLTLKGEKVELRSIAERDLEFLRLLKNANKQAFFHKEEITAEQQRGWFAGYLERADDFMFVVNEAAGCLAARLTDDGVDCYNIMAAPEYKGKGLMLKAMRTMTDWARAKWKRPISLIVVEGNNVALGFYSRCGFTRSVPGPRNSQKLFQEDGR